MLGVIVYESKDNAPKPKTQPKQMNTDTSARLLEISLVIETVKATIENNPEAYPLGSKARKEALLVLSRLISIEVDLKAKA